jgi:hypothetical protein
MPPAELLRELEELVATTADTVARLAEGDESSLAALIARREAIIARLAESSVPVDEGLTKMVRRALALDTDLVTMLRMRLTHVRGELDQIARTRRSLTSYGAARPGGAVYVERLG